MKNLVFDVNVILDLWLERKSEAQLLQLAGILESGTGDGYNCWICSSSLHVLEYVTRRELKRDGADPHTAKLTSRQLMEQLFEYVSVLSCFGFQQDDNLLSRTDLEDAQIVRAASLLNSPTSIVTNEKRFDTSGTEVLELMPSEVPGWLREPASSSIVFVDLAAQQDGIRTSLEKNIHTVLHHGRYILGPEVAELENRLAEYTGVKHCISCSSGTDALLMSLMALDVGPGDAVFTTPFTFIATADVIARLGATPVFVDIDPQTYNIDPDKLEQAIQAVQQNDPSQHPLPRTPGSMPHVYPVKQPGGLPVEDRSFTEAPCQLNPKCVIPVDLYGLPCDYDRIFSVVSSYNEERGTTNDQRITIIQDAAQSFGAEYQGGLCPTLGDIGCTSFFPSKPLGGYGDGGALFTDNADLADKLKSIRVHGQGLPGETNPKDFLHSRVSLGASKYDTIRLGLKGRMDTLQAAIVLPKLEIYPHELEQRRQAAQYYNELLGPGSSALVPPFVPQGYNSAWALYTVLAMDSEQRSDLQTRLKNAGIPSVIYYGRPLHLQPLFEPLGYRQGDFPVAEDCASRCFSLPMHPYLSWQEQERICEVIRDTVNNT
ncbi:DegT/DnrJ/EryC1/StrS family aminotransferase [Desulfonatronospira sp.]|uniref:DegT/DnrJ/EryC1/StrS family aminotransferase n=1 Tax=Desulfonatronospira sp. TaxID=1962951 RepID=UPI00342E1C87